jgi:hypothetical protein
MCNITNDRIITSCDVHCGKQLTKDVQARTPYKAVDDIMYLFTLVMTLRGYTRFRKRASLVHSNNEAHNILNLH